MVLFAWSKRVYKKDRFLLGPVLLLPILNGGKDSELDIGKDTGLGILTITHNTSQNGAQVQSQGQIHVRLDLQAQSSQTDLESDQDIGVNAREEVSEIELDRRGDVGQDSGVDIGTASGLAAGVDEGVNVGADVSGEVC